MVEADEWCPDIMKQLSAVQGMLAGINPEDFRHRASAAASARVICCPSRSRNRMGLPRMIVRHVPRDELAADRGARLSVAGHVRP